MERAERRVVAVIWGSVWLALVMVAGSASGAGAAVGTGQEGVPSTSTREHLIHIKQKTGGLKKYATMDKDYTETV